MTVLVHYGTSTPVIDTPHAPGDELDYAFAWGDWLEAGESIASNSWSSDGVFDIESSTNVASLTINGVVYTIVHIVWLSAASESVGKRGKITQSITTDSVPPRTRQRSFYLDCEPPL